MTSGNSVHLNKFNGQYAEIYTCAALEGLDAKTIYFGENRITEKIITLRKKN